ncbi:MAG: hypothetical protein WAJ97_11165, partial [Terriglobales bacterium]
SPTLPAKCQGVLFYERAFEEFRLVYTRVPSPRKMQTLVQVGKQLWEWRRSRCCECYGDVSPNTGG